MKGKKTQKKKIKEEHKKQIWEELDQKDRTIRKLKVQLDESLSLEREVKAARTEQGTFKP